MTINQKSEDNEKQRLTMHFFYLEQQCRQYNRIIRLMQIDTHVGKLFM